MSGQNLLLSPSDIAELAQVGRPVVSNWRRRHADFPHPVGGTDARPLFQRDSVVAWLESRGHTLHIQSPDAGIWSALNALRGETAASTAGRLVLTLALMKKNHPHRFSEIHDSDDPIPLLVEAEKELGASAPELVSPLMDLRGDEVGPVIAAVSDTDAKDLPQTADLVLERLNRAQVRSGGEAGFIGSRISALLSSLASRATGTVYDPACGIANALLQTAGAGSAARLVGTDWSADSLVTAAQRAELHGVQLELYGGDVLADDPVPDLVADAVVLEPPFSAKWDPPAAADPRFRYGIASKNRSELAWIQHALAHLSPTGRAYVVTSPGALVQGAAERAIRENLLREGCIEAIIGLPPRMLPQTSIPLALWVLRSPQEAEDVLFIDASDTELVEQKIAEWLDPTETIFPSIEAPHAHTPVDSIVAADSVLTPARWVGDIAVDPDEVIDSFRETSQRVNDTLGHLEKIELTYSDLHGLTSPRITSVTELIENGVLDLQLGRTRPPASDAAAERADVVRPTDVRRSRLSDPSPQHLLDESGRTKPGDVLITSLGKTAAMVDTTGHHDLAIGVERLRVLDPSALDPHFLAFSIGGSWNERFQRGTVSMRTPVRDLEIPVLPVDQQKSIIRLAQRLEQLEELAADLQSSCEQLGTVILDAVHGGIDVAGEDQP